MGIGIFLSLLKNKNLIYMVLGLVVLTVIGGGWYLYFQETKRTDSLKADLALFEAPPDTVFIQGDVEDSVKVDTTYTKPFDDWNIIAKQIARLTDRLRGKQDSMVNMESYIDSLSKLLQAEIKPGEVQISETHSGVVKLDSTIAGKLTFEGTVWFPSGKSELIFKFPPPPKPGKRLLSAGIGIGYHSRKTPFVIADVNIRRFGVGVYAESDDKFGGYIRFNF